MNLRGLQSLKTWYLHTLYFTLLKKRLFFIFQIVVQDYAQSFRDVLAFENSNPNDAKTLKEFSEQLWKIRERHTNTVITMAEAVIQMKQTMEELQENNGHNGQKQPRFMENIQYFLDRMYTSRISTRMLINQHTALFSNLENVNNTLTV